MSSTIKKSALLIVTGFILFYSSHSFASDCTQSVGETAFLEANCTIPPNGSGKSATCTKAYSNGKICGQLTCEVFIGVDYGDDVPLAYLYKNRGEILPKSSKYKSGMFISYQVDNKVLKSQRYYLTAKKDPSKIDNNQIIWTEAGIASVCNEEFSPPSTPTNIQVKTGLQMYGLPPIAGGYAVAKLTWDESVSATSYTVEYCPSFPCPSSPWPTKTCSGSPCLIQYLSPTTTYGITYAFKVSASNKIGTGLSSSVIKVDAPTHASVYGLISGLAEGGSVTITTLPDGAPKTFNTSPFSYNIPYGSTSLSVSGSNGQNCSMADLQIPEFAYERRISSSNYIVFKRNIACN